MDKKIIDTKINEHGVVTFTYVEYEKEPIHATTGYSFKVRVEMFIPLREEGEKVDRLQGEIKMGSQGRRCLHRKLDEEVSFEKEARDDIYRIL